MDQLCELCWEEILSHLEVKDRITTVQVWPNIFPPWIRFHKNFCHDHLLDALCCNRYHFLLHALHNQIEIMTIASMNSMQEEIFKTFTFPNVHKLRITTWAVAYSDRDIKLLTTMFPNIRAIRMKYIWGPFSGRYFKDWRLLNNVALPRASCLEVEYLREMMMRLPLETLELANIGYNIELLGYEIFSKLSKITIFSYQMQWFLRGPIEELINLKCFGIICYEQGGDEAVSQFFYYIVRKNLWIPGQLTIEYSSLAPVLIWSYRYELMGLREVHLVICHLAKYDFINLIVNFKNLRLLKIESCSFGFLSCRINVASIVQFRMFPLMFLYDSLMYGTFKNLSTTRVEMFFEGSSCLFTAKNGIFPP